MQKWSTYHSLTRTLGCRILRILGMIRENYQRLTIDGVTPTNSRLIALDSRGWYTPHWRFHHDRRDELEMLLWSLVPSEWDQALKIFHWADRHGGLRVGVWGWRSPVFKPFGRNYPAFQSISWRLDRVVALASTFLFCVFSICFDASLFYI